MIELHKKALQHAIDECSTAGIDAHAAIIECYLRHAVTYVYDPDDWECTYELRDRSIIHDSGERGVVEVHTFVAGPVVWQFLDDDSEVQEFQTEDEADVAYAKMVEKTR